MRGPAVERCGALVALERVRGQHGRVAPQARLLQRRHALLWQPCARTKTLGLSPVKPQFLVPSQARLLQGRHALLQQPCAHARQRRQQCVISLRGNPHCTYQVLAALFHSRPDKD